jgi:hypothetical protein
VYFAPCSCSRHKLCLCPYQIRRCAPAFGSTSHPKLFDYYFSSRCLTRSLSASRSALLATCARTFTPPCPSGLSDPGLHQPTLLCVSTSSSWYFLYIFLPNILLNSSMSPVFTISSTRLICLLSAHNRHSLKLLIRLVNCEGHSLDVRPL